MNQQSFTKWLDQWSHAWESRTTDRREIEILFSDQSWWGRPTVPARVTNVWMSEVQTASDIHTSWEVLCVNETVGVAVLTASWIDKGTIQITGEGFFMVKLDDQGRAFEIDEHWTQQSIPLPQYR
jgi:hypothetical protein